MNHWFCVSWQVISFGYLVMAALHHKPNVIEVKEGETATIECPSNDDNHRFQFWQLSSNEILGPGNRLNTRKYKYDVLSGTLYIRRVKPEEKGIYTCYCKHIVNSTFNAKSVILVVSSDWRQLWETDYSVNMFRLGMILATILILAFVIYVIYNNIRRDHLMEFKDFRNESTSDEISSRKASYSLSRTGRNIELKEGIDNPGMDINLSRETTPTFNYNTIR